MSVFKMCFYRLCRQMLVTTFVFYLVPTITKAQDPIFSLFESTAVNFNPAHVGNSDFSRINAGYRNQYPTYKSPFVTYYASFDAYAPKINSGFGFMLMNDKIAKGVFTNTAFTLAYSNNIQLSDNVFLRLGLSATYFSRKRDPNGLIFPDMPYFGGNVASANNYPIVKINSVYVGTGFSLMYKNFKIGTAILNFGGKSLSKPEDFHMSKPVKLTAYVTINLPISSKYYEYKSKNENEIFISPFVRYTRQYDFEDFDFGTYFNADMFFVGLSHRTDTKFKNATFVIAAGIKTPVFNIGYSANFGNIGSGSRYVSAHEVSLTIKIKNADKKRDIQGIYINDNVKKKQRSRVYKCPY